MHPAASAFFSFYSTTAALPDGPALTPPTFEMEGFFLFITLSGTYSNVRWKLDQLMLSVRTLEHFPFGLNWKDAVFHFN